MDTSDLEDSASCRLVRADGSEWRVTELRGVERGLRVDAVRSGRENGDRPANGSPGSGGPNGSPPAGPNGEGRLQDELLGRGDRLQWLDEDGRLLWSMKLPMDQARSA